MKAAAILALLLLPTCIGSVEISLERGLTCEWNGNVVYSGPVHFGGSGLEGFESYLDGRWRLCNSSNGVTCHFHSGLVEDKVPEAKPSSGSDNPRKHDK